MYRCEIRGRVQGVGFRWFVRETALELGVRGTVQNMPDGSVVVFATASQRVLEKFIERLWTGSPHAVVESVEQREASMPDMVTDFRIL